MILLSPPLSLRPNPISSSSLSPLPLSLLINGAPKSHCRARGSRFTVCLATKPLIKDRVLRVNGREALSGVPENVTLSHITAAAACSEGSDSASASASASFLGAVADREDCRHVFKIGVLRDCRLVCLFRFRIFWMIPRFGNSASDIPQETQMLLLEIKEDKSVSNEVDGNSEDPITYILLLPVLDGLFRSSLQGNSSDELEFCIESGSRFANYLLPPFTRKLREQSLRSHERIHEVSLNCSKHHLLFMLSIDPNIFLL
ncbi:putative galactinol--sucrose galactosyltransferase 2 [Ananas comosus]|uniref:Putative galactinol--sucrose galactosyltransferase 2 n=1 Tax=Ananas comosus TaxID=4615 RepID=A0A199VWY9_ANACO|nr:putative galactinol--sucrose galactosyltransferase 2 [Ananas comosus]